MRRGSQPLQKYLLCLALLLISIIVIYSPIFHAGLFTIDDRLLLSSPVIYSDFDWTTVKTVFTPGSSPDYYPMRDLSYIFDHHFLSSSGAYIRLHPVLLFGASCLLIFFICLALNVSAWLSLSLAAVWGLHPVHVEMVSWFSARKDILALYYGLWAVLLFVWANKKNSKLLFTLSGLAYLFSLLSKASFAALPFIGLLFWLFGLSRKNRKALSALGVTAVIAILYVSFVAWFYSSVNDMTASYPFSFRVQASVIGLAKILGGWLVPRWNIFDAEDQDWVSRLFPFFILGVIVWAFLIFCGVRAVKKKQRRVQFFLFSGLALYLPISGLIFPHRHFYSVRYGEPCFALAMIICAFEINKALKRMKQGRIRTLRMVFMFIIAILAMATYTQTSVWSDSLAVLNQSLKVQSNSIILATYKYMELQNRVSENPKDRNLIQEKLAIGSEIEKLCEHENPGQYNSCSQYWESKLRDVNSGEEQAKILNQIRMAQGEIVSLSNLNAPNVKEILFQLREGQLDMNLLKSWSEKKRWKTLTDDRLVDWVSQCLLESPRNARKVLSSYEKSHLVFVGSVKTLVENQVHPVYKAQLIGCL